MFVNYFTGIFSSSSPSDIREVAESSTSRLNDEQVLFLNADYTKAEVVAAIKDMGPDKPPGPDGVNVGFFQQRWNVMGSDVVKEVLDVLNNYLSVSDNN